MKTIKQYIEQKNISVGALSELLGLNKSTVYRHLKGQKFKLETARKYSVALHIPIESLLDQVA